LTACAGTQEDKSFTTEKLLVAAGFNYKEAQTQEHLVKLKKLPQERLFRHEIKGKPVYLYANAAGCKCLYAGDEAAYKRFRELHREARLNAQQHKGLLSQENLQGIGEDWAAYVDDLGSGMLPDDF
jgi:hypothetical protein